jgi:tetratricopeptide (TPR) repeat protein
LEEPDLLASNFLGLGMIAWAQSDYSDAFQFGENSLDLYRKCGDELGVADAKRLLGQVLRLQGEYGKATEYFEQSMDLYKKTNDRRGMARTLESLGLVARVRGDLDQAVALASESLELRREMNDSFGISYSLYNLGAAAYEQGTYEQARVYLEESLSMRRRLGDQLGMAAAINVLGDIALDQDNAKLAQHLYQESLSMRRTMGDKYGVADDLQGLGQASILLDDIANAAVFFEERLALAAELDVLRITASAQRDWARIQYRLGKRSAAFELLRENVSLCQRDNYPRGVVDCLETWAGLLTSEQEAPSALSLLGCAEGMRTTLHYLRSPREVKDHERLLSALRDLVEEEDFDTIQAECHGLTAGQVIAGCNLDK